MALIAKTKAFPAKAGKTKYLTIPSAIAQDSAFPFNSMNEVLIMLVPNKGLLVIPPDKGFLIDEKQEATTIYLRDEPERA